MKRLLVCLLLLGSATACSSDAKEAGGGTGRVVGLTGLLARVPDTAASREHVIFYSDLARLRGGRHADSAADDLSLLGDASSRAFFLPSSLASGIGDPTFAEYTGFDTRDIDATLEFGVLPDGVSIVVGDVKAGSIKKGLLSSPGGDDLQSEKVDGVTFFALGDEGSIDIEHRSVIRGLGQPLRMATDGNTLYWGRSRAAIDACVAAGGGTSLADDANYSAVAARLDAAQVVNGALFSPRAGEPWTVGGLGEAFEGGTSTVTVVLQYGTPAMAAAAATAFTAHVQSDESLRTNGPWADIVTVTDAHADGTMMLATLASKQPGVAFDVLQAQDNLLQF